MVWACNLCKKKYELLVKTGQWYHGGMAKPVQMDIDTGSDASSIKTDSTPTHDKRTRFPIDDRLIQDGQGSEKENIVQNIPAKAGGDPKQLSRSGSLLKRQYSVTDGNRLHHRDDRGSQVEDKGEGHDLASRSHGDLHDEGVPRHSDKSSRQGGDPRGRAGEGYMHGGDTRARDTSQGRGHEGSSKDVPRSRMDMRQHHGDMSPSGRGDERGRDRSSVRDSKGEGGKPQPRSQSRERYGSREDLRRREDGRLRYALTYC